MNAHVTIELHQPPRAAVSKGALSECSVSLDIDTVQRSVEGIQLTIEIANRGSKEIEILNPLDFLAAGLLILDPAGRLMSLPPVPPRLLVNTRGPERNRLLLPFRLNFVELGEKRLSDLEINESSIRLPSHSHLRIGIRIDRIVLPGSPGSASREPVPIPPGEWRLEVSVILVSAGNTAISRTLRSPETTLTLE